MTKTSSTFAAAQRLDEPEANPQATAAKRLMIVRHSKAVEEDAAGDHARSLSEAGTADAQALGKWLASQRLHSDLALCSSAQRTRETLAAITHNVPTILSDKLYLAGVGDMLSAIQSTDDAVKNLMMVCHNPGAHALLALLVGEYANEADADKLLLKFPTSACALLTLSIKRWRDVAPHTAILERLRY